jgi:hypothetical protein
VSIFTKLLRFPVRLPNATVASALRWSAQGPQQIFEDKEMARFCGVFRASVLGLGLTLPMAVVLLDGAVLLAQDAAPATARQIGTVKAISGGNLTLTTDSGQSVAVSVPDGAHVLQLAPGSTDLKTATAAALTDVAIGDRVLVTGKPSQDGSSFAAVRVILMKAGDLAQKHEAEQADWQKRGNGGLVSAVDAGSGAVTITSGAKKVQVNTTSKTTFRRYAGDSVKFEDAVPGTLAQIQSGDQLRVRGAKSDDGSSIQAEEIVSGSFKNLAGVIATLDAANGSLTLKDLASKKAMTVKVTANSSVRALPPTAAAMLARRARGGAGTGAQAGTAAGGENSARANGGGAGRTGGGDLSQIVSKLPAGSVKDLKVGDAVMIVGSEASPGSSTVTAVTLLSGVEPILAASPNSTPEMTLSPWNMGGGGGGGGGESGGGPQ